MSARCPNNHVNREGARFCRTCGVELQPQGPAAYSSHARAPAAGPRAASLPSRVAPAPSPRYVPRASPASGAQGGLATALPLVIVFCGGFAVLAAFFMGWLAFSLPAVSMLLGASSPMTISGYDLVMMGPGTYRSVPVILVVLIPGLGALGLLLTGFAALPDASWRPLLGVAHIMLGVAGLVALAVLLTSARAEPEQLIRELGLKGAAPSLLSAALIRVEPASGYAVNLVGFVLLLIGGMADFVFQTRGRQRRV
jgi:hypothetical protein